jgi:hypothetical protein
LASSADDPARQISRRACRRSSEGRGRAFRPGAQTKAPPQRGSGAWWVRLCVLPYRARSGPSKTQQAHHPNAQPLRWLMVAAETTAGHRKSPARSGAKSAMWAAEKGGRNASPHRDTTTETVAQHTGNSHSGKQTVIQPGCIPTRIRFSVRARRRDRHRPPYSFRRYASRADTSTAGRPRAAPTAASPRNSASIRRSSNRNRSRRASNSTRSASENIPQAIAARSPRTNIWRTATRHAPAQSRLTTSLRPDHSIQRSADHTRDRVSPLPR